MSEPVKSPFLFGDPEPKIVQAMRQMKAEWDAAVAAEKAAEENKIEKAVLAERERCEAEWATKLMHAEAKAILAERDRCAMLAHMHGGGYEVANAIRAGE